MRRFLLAAIALGVTSGAQAADMPDIAPVLRGSFTPTSSWSGWYAGGTAAYNSSAHDFSGSLSGLTNFIYRDTVLEEPTSGLSALGKATTQGTGFGAFVGRNWQWDDVVLGVEANYNYLSRLSTSTSSSLGPLLIVNPAGETPAPGDTDSYSVTVSGSAKATLQDMLTFRARAGWAFDDFLPYAFGGLAVARVDVQRSVTTYTSKNIEHIQTNPDGSTTVTNTGYIKLPQVSLTQSQGRSNNFVAGWTAGLGFEYRLWGGLFARAEWEYVGLMPIQNVSININSARAGLGYKF